MNPLQRAGKSLRTAREGTARTVRWAGSGIARGPRRMAAAVRRDRTGAEAEAAAAAPAVEAVEKGPGLIARLRESEHNLGLWAAGALLVAIWIGWAVYVWTENGAAAGIGVLVTWPAVFAALALVTSPLWATGLYVRHRRVAGANGDAAAAAPEPPKDRQEPEDGAKDEGEPGTEGQPAPDADSDAGDEPDVDEDADAGDGEKD